MQEMDAATLDELHALRARAYGPAADIDQDPAAVRRLAELEALRSGSAATRAAAAPVEASPVPERAPVTPPAPPVEPPPALIAPVPAEIAVPPTPAAEVVTDAAGADGAASDSRPPRRRRVGLWWALSLVAVAALAAGATYAVTRVLPVAVSSGAEQIATLEPSATITVPDGWFGAGPSSTAYEFYGLTLFQTAYGVNGPGSDCFTVIRTDQLPDEDADPNNWSINGSMYSGCRVGGFPATVEMPIDTSAPKELTDRYPIGGALQFVVDGDRIGVFLDEG